MRRLGLAGLALASLASGAEAQSWVPWHQPSLLGEPRQARAAPSPGPANQGAPRRLASLQPEAPPKPQPAPAVLDGGGRPSIAPSAPSAVSVRTGHGAGTIVIDTSARRLYLMQSDAKALAYPISVGRDGFRWTGTERISRVADWPDWRPPSEMRQRQPGLPELMTGGVKNPLGAKALYLGSSLYRIHGTNSAQSIGQANSSGCFRMTNGHVIDLANRVGTGTTVVVKSRL